MLTVVKVETAIVFLKHNRRGKVLDFISLVWVRRFPVSDQLNVAIHKLTSIVLSRARRNRHMIYKGILGMNRHPWLGTRPQNR